MSHNLRNFYSTNNISCGINGTLLETVGFDATDCSGENVVAAGYVDKQLTALVKDEDLSRYILLKQHLVIASVAQQSRK